MYNRNDPRFRRRINQLTQNLESANESAQVGLFSFTQHYLKPCFGAVNKCVEPCTTRLFPTLEERKRRGHRCVVKSRGTGPEYSFDFYDDWEEDENDALLSLENDEFDRLIGGSAGAGGVDGDVPVAQPGRHGVMSYGARSDERYSGPRRRSAVLPYDGKGDPTVIPNQSRFGFLSKLPFRFGGGKGLRYKPSAADLQERPRAKDGIGGDVHDTYHDGDVDEEGDMQDGEQRTLWQRSNRIRSTTTGSGHTTDSYSSRGDIFPSDDEAADAVPLGDEFTITFDRRTTYDESSSGRTLHNSSNKRPGGTRSSTRTISSRSSRGRGSNKSRKSSGGLKPGSRGSDREAVYAEQAEGEEERGAYVPTIADLNAEEQQAQADEEEEIERKRGVAIRLAKEKGLQLEDHESEGRRQWAQTPIHTPSSQLKTQSELTSPPEMSAAPSRQLDIESGGGFPFPTIGMLQQSSEKGRKDRSMKSSVEMTRAAPSTGVGANSGGATLQSKNHVT